MLCEMSGSASLKSDVLALHLEATPVGGVLDNVLLQDSCVRFKVVGFLTGHPATKPTLLEEWT